MSDKPIKATVYKTESLTPEILRRISGEAAARIEAENEGRARQEMAKFTKELLVEVLRCCFMDAQNGRCETHVLPEKKYNQEIIAHVCAELRQRGFYCTMLTEDEGEKSIVVKWGE